MYFLLGSVKELREGFISVLFPAEGAPSVGACSVGRISCYTAQLERAEGSTKRDLDLKVGIRVPLKGFLVLLSRRDAN